MQNEINSETYAAGYAAGVSDMIAIMFANGVGAADIARWTGSSIEDVWTILASR